MVNLAIERSSPQFQELCRAMLRFMADAGGSDNPYSIMSAFAAALRENFGQERGQELFIECVEYQIDKDDLPFALNELKRVSALRAEIADLKTIVGLFELKDERDALKKELQTLKAQSD